MLLDIREVGEAFESKKRRQKGRGCPHEVEELKPMIAELL
jgi:hypothetical protein